MRHLERRLRKLESPQRDRGAAFLAALKAMNADRPETPEDKAELEEAFEAFHAACNGNWE
jgi:hypothetical protein